ncbi:ABC transporter permease [Natronosalvus halobius]|uniref:ABC transporter permease n=1 Tax=Natronosalvus halobius TaxID=2953746 RepID=UPI0020A13BCC|nr:ABC transporter permease [Natronosalvus halobius]USZ73684.1 ABC transporter permease [Natronosalvus halobius]
MSLGRYILNRLLQSVPVVIGIITITFILINLMPGDPIRIMIVEGGADPEVIRKLESRYGLDQPLHERYFNYLLGVFQGDLGESIHYGVPVVEKIFERLPATLLLVVSAFTFAISMAVPLGVLAAHRKNKPTDHLSRIVALIGVSTPSFWIGLLLIILFAFHLQWLPSSGLIYPWADPDSVRFLEGGLLGSTLVSIHPRLAVLYQAARHLLLPTIALGTLQMAAIMRIERAEMLETLQADYVELARAYGVSERTILRRHAFRVAQLPVVTIVGLNLTSALGGAVLIETVFNINGLGRLIIEAIQNLDYPLVMGTTIFFGLVFVIGVIITDVSYAYIDPRVSYGERE